MDSFERPVGCIVRRIGRVVTKEKSLLTIYIKRLTSNGHEIGRTTGSSSALRQSSGTRTSGRYDALDDCWR